MQPMKFLIDWLQQNASSERYLFSADDLRPLCLNLSDTSFKTLLTRTVQAGHLSRACRGLYVYQKNIPSTGLLLFHAAAQLRSTDFNYISLGTALSDVGVISQMPMNWISIMSSGRSNVISCGDFGTIEFVHTNKKPEEVMDQLTYNADRRLWTASVALALKDMKATQRNCDLIDWEVANELIR